MRVVSSCFATARLVAAATAAVAAAVPAVFAFVCAASAYVPQIHEEQPSRGGGHLRRPRGPPSAAVAAAVSWA